MLDQERGKSDSTQGYIRVRDTTKRGGGGKARVFSCIVISDARLMKRIFLVFLVMQHIRNNRVFRIRQRL